jgi:hypothetical protein
MTLDHFKDFSAGLESLAIVIATFLGGGWALYQFFSLRALDKAKVDLEKARMDLVQRGILVIDLAAESFQGNGSYFLHVQVVIRNIGNRSETIDWKKTVLFARRFYRAEGDKLGAADQMLMASQASDLKSTIFEPGYTLSQSFLILIPQPGVYSIEFITQASPTESADLFKDMEKSGVKVAAGSSLAWEANKFVSIPQAQPNAAPAALTKT